MNKESEGSAGTVPDGPGLADLHGAHRRTLDTLFRHPTAHNLEWMDVMSLFERIGAVAQRPNDKLWFEFAGQHLLLPRGHGKELGPSEVASLRQLIRRAAGTAGGTPPSAGAGAPPPAAVVVEIDHHGARLFSVGQRSADGRTLDIKPYDPHHFLHHLTHRDQSRQEGQRSPEDPSYYARISEALAAAPRIVLVGHGEGRSNAAAHLMEYLKKHHPETHRKVVRAIETDLSALTLPQIGALAREALEASGV